MPNFADVTSFRRLPEQEKDPRIIFFLVYNQADRDRFSDEVLEYFSETDVVVECPDTDRLRQVIAEVMALEAVRREAQALNTDPVAQREFKDHYAIARGNEQDLLRGIAENPNTGTWYWKGETLGVRTKRELQSTLSRILGRVYHASPIIQNELINRDKLSSQAAAARNKLLAAMLGNRSKPGLGIDKYPPERTIHMALLQAPGIHRFVDGSWQFGRPTSDDKFNLEPVWRRIERFVTDAQDTPQPFTTLDEDLQAPPFGLKRGVLPILYIAACLSDEDEIALFEEGRYIPYLTPDRLERFVRRPEDFAVQSFRIEGLCASLYKEYARLLFGNLDRETSVLAIARPLAKFMDDLPEFSKTTKRGSPTAQEVRSAFTLAKSPQVLLFEQLPAACGLPTSKGRRRTSSKLRAFSEQLKEVLRELKDAYSELLAYFQKLVAQAFNLDRTTNLADLRAVLRGRLEGLDSYTIDIDGLRAFIRRITKTYR